jgi:histidyl-tRNA synthetase
MEKLDRFPRQLQPAARIMFVNFGKKETIKALEVLQELRNANIESEIYPDPAKMKKQMSYADSKSIAYVGMIGEDEMARNMITVKNMATGEQKQMDVQELKVLLING